ncbi:MAG: hypothetical protein PHS14_01675 [Elusimicrobia bacterium]|nr:hypothetical protein [Elusimicrobiota bacterium]
MNCIRRYLQQSLVSQSWMAAKRSDAVVVARSGCGLKPQLQRARAADKRRGCEQRL